MKDIPSYFNEVYIVVTIIVCVFFYKKLPKKFPLSIMLLNFVFSVSIGLSADHLIATPPFDLYDVNDTPENEILDVIYYFMYGFSGYFFLYFYEQWGMKGFLTIFYIVMWSLFSVLYEWIAMHVGIFDYSKGYDIKYSFPVYLYSQSFYLLFYQFIKKEYNKQKKQFTLHN